MRQTSATVHNRVYARLAKILLLVLGLFIAYCILKSYKKKVQRRDEPPKGAEDMVRCAQCGVHLPRSESLTTNNQAFYCSADHRRLHERAP
ncbi:MAG: hypothetical protein JWO70_2808 [Betaproteobacteria bacterium]|nr:hypothetical protein [Betaproteobacteria bacterium]